MCKFVRFYYQNECNDAYLFTLYAKRHFSCIYIRTTSYFSRNLTKYNY